MQERRDTQQGQQGRVPRREEELRGGQTQETDWTREQLQQHQPGQGQQQHSGYGGGITGPTGFGYSGGHESTGAGHQAGYGTGLGAFESGGGGGGGAGQAHRTDWTSQQQHQPGQGHQQHTGGITGPAGFGYSGGHETGYGTGVGAYESGGGVGVGYPTGGAGGGDYPSADPDAVIGRRGARTGGDIPTADPDIVEERKGATGRRTGGGGGARR